MTIWVWIDTDAGIRVMIYQGSGPTAQMTDVNGAMWHKGIGFHPGGAIAAGGEIWFPSFAPSFTIWHWDETRGLGEVDVNLVDPHVLLVMPAGPCF